MTQENGRRPRASRIVPLVGHIGEQGEVSWRDGVTDEMVDRLVAPVSEGSTQPRD